MNKSMMKPMGIVLGMFLAACGNSFSDKERIENWIMSSSDNVQFISIDPNVTFQTVRFDAGGVVAYSRERAVSIFSDPRSQIILQQIEVEGFNGNEGQIQRNNLERCRVRRLDASAFDPNQISNILRTEGTLVVPVEINLVNCLEFVQNASYTLHFITGNGFEFRVTKKLILRE